MQRELDELRLILGKSIEKILRLQETLEGARNQVAWLLRQLFGPKAERIPKAESEKAWLEYLQQQEAKAKGMRMSTREECSSIAFQLLFDLVASQVEHPAHAKAHEPEPLQPEPEGPEPTESPKSLPPGPKTRDNHGRKKPPETLPTVTIELEPEEDDLDHGENKRRVEVEVSYSA